jgi:hypothetical protein
MISSVSEMTGWMACMILASVWGSFFPLRHRVQTGSGAPLAVRGVPVYFFCGGIAVDALR